MRDALSALGTLGHDAMNGLVEEIQKSAIDPNVPVSTLLLQVKLAAAKLKLEKVESWVELESNGYTETEVPEYRKVGGRPMIETAYHGWQPLTVDSETESLLAKAQIGNSIASIEEMISKSDGSYVRLYPAGIIQSLSKSNGERFVSGGCVIQRSAFANILSSVRNLVLDWALQLERAGITGDGISFSNQEREKASEVRSIINIGAGASVVGNLGVAHVARDISFASHIDIDKVKNLVAQVGENSEALVNEGVNREELNSALARIETQLAKPEPTLLRLALEELKAAVAKATGKLMASGVLTILNQILGTGVPTPGG